MKALDIALKDMRQSFRSKGAIVFMFVVPILITVLFSFMFGSIAGGDEEFTLPVVPVVLVNLDEGQAPGVGSMGSFLADTLQEEALADLLKNQYGPWPPWVVVHGDGGALQPNHTIDGELAQVLQQAHKRALMMRPGRL